MEDFPPSDLGVGCLVRRKQNTREAGQILEILTPTGRPRARIQFATGTRTVPLDQIEPVPSSTDSASDLLRTGSFSNLRDLRRHLAHVRLSGRMSDMLYSLEATDTDFYAHQFKPVLKILDSPTGHLLIADEVGLGKTIEAGLIWTELSARLRYRRLLIVCPKVLCEKWRAELTSKFDLDARIMTPDDLRDALTNSSRQQRGFIGICGMQSIRPRRNMFGQKRPVDLLSIELEKIDSFDDRLDLVVIDEAHHMRNPGTQTNQLGQLLAKIARHVVMLSATPINLRNRDLHSLLRLLDEDTFTEEEILESIIDANAPIIKARDAVLAGRPTNEIRDHLEMASKHELLSSTKTLSAIRREIRDHEGLDAARRADLAIRLDGMNQLANVINRTRRRDVQEHRVIREVFGQALEMSHSERGVYVAMTQVVREFAAQRGNPVGFLTVMPQRMLASSIPAALEHWRTRKSTESEFEDEPPLDEEEEDIERLADRLSAAALHHPSLSELEAVDTKYDALSRLLGKLREDPVRRKVIVFSTFRTTLRYLERRLCLEGHQAIRLDGDVKDRESIIERFRDDHETMILLSSEVGSEGIDLEFAQIVVNYDLPWNPMKVEQRIGRVDRLGQKSDKVFIYNLVHHGTIEGVIWHRLYDRLKLCQNALGGFEAILAEALERELSEISMDPQLTDDQRDFRLTQSAQAFENNRREEEKLESRAAALIAHGDYVASEIRRKREHGQWITQADLSSYVATALEYLHPGSRVSFDDTRAILEVRLDSDARSAFRAWCEGKRMDGGELAVKTETMSYRLGNDSSRRRIARMTANHPLVRYLSEMIDDTGGIPESAIAIRVTALEDMVAHGTYVGVVQEWRFGTDLIDTRLVWRLADLLSGDMLTPETSEAVLRHAISHGTPFTGAEEHVDFQEAADLADILLDDVLAHSFDNLVERRVDEMEDRLAIQLASLQRAEARDVSRIESTIAKAGPRMEAANRGRLRALRERIADRRMQLERRVNRNGEAFTVASFLIRVEGSKR